MAAVLIGYAVAIAVVPVFLNQSTAPQGTVTGQARPME
jgi:hypothetical protein